MKVLVVDDEAVIRRIISRRLDSEGHETVTAPDVASAEAALEAGGFALIITDIRMPGRSGIELLHTAKRKYPELEVVVMTGYDKIETAVSAVDEHAFAYFRKPFCVEELAKVVQRIDQHITLRKERRLHAAQLEALVKQLEASERRYRDLVEGINAAMISADRDLRVRSASQRCTEILGRTPAELVGMSIDDLRSRDACGDFRQRLEALLERGTGFIRVDCRITRPDGSVLETTEIATPLTGDSAAARPSGICWIIADRSAAARLEREAEAAREQLEAIRRARSESRRIVGEGEAIKEVLRTIQRVAPTDASVLICGESGTGKELVAESVHLNSNRKDKPFVVINCATLPETLLESELFGYKKGAFTGAVSDKRGLVEMTDRGTLFVDEITEMTPRVQGKLLRVLETGEFRRLGSTKDQRTDIRVVAASNRDLSKQVKAGTFRDDLLYRLDVVRIEVPPLRERPEDIPLIAEHLLQHSPVTIRKPKHLSSAALQALTSYEWPGNVRELSNVLERAVILSGNRQEIRIEDLSIPSGKPAARIRTLRQLEEAEIKRALAVTKGNKARAASLLGISRQTVINKLKQYRESWTGS